MTRAMSIAAVTVLFTFAQGAAQELDSNGTKIRYTVAGTGEPVVLIHGFLGSSEEWLSPPPFLPPGQQESFVPAFETLSTEFTAIALDCRGHGQSGKPKGESDYGTEMVEDVVRLLDHLEIPKAHIVGYSMGAFLAAKLVELHPDRVKSVVLGGGGALLEGSEQLAFMESLGKSLASGRGIEPIILGMTPPDQPKPTAEQIAETNEMFLASQDEEALAMVALGHGQLTVAEAALASNGVPALLVVGGNDPLRTSSEETHALMSSSELAVLDGLDHVSTEMSPDFVTAIQRFVRKNR